MSQLDKQLLARLLQTYACQVQVKDKLVMGELLEFHGGVAEWLRECAIGKSSSEVLAAWAAVPEHVLSDLSK